MSFPKRFLLVPVLIAIFAYLFYSAYHNIKVKTLNEFNFQQLTLASQASKGIESFFNYYNRELRCMSKISNISDLDSQGMSLLEEFYRNHSDQIEAISIVDAKGILKYTFPYNKSVIGKDISSQEHIKSLLKTHNPTVSDVFISIQGFRTIAYHIPIISGNEYKGSIAILIPLDNLGKHFIQNIRTGKTGYGWMMSKEGVQLYDPNNTQPGQNARNLYNKYPSVLELIDRTLTETQGASVCYTGSSGKEKDKSDATLATFYRVSLENTFWTILIFTPEKEVFESLISFRNRLILLFLLIILVSIIYSYFGFKASTVLREEKKRKALENVLIESEKRFRVIFELSPAGIILIDKDGTIIEVNSAFCESLGYRRDELLAKNIRIFSSPSANGDIEKNIAEILSGKTKKHEVTNIRKDGTRFLVALYETQIDLPNGSPGILSVSNDITDREKVHRELITAKEKAEESDKLKSAFLTNMSHELRTPLNAIIGFSGLMIDTASDNETKSFLKIIADSGQHLLGLVEEILDISMIETGQLKINYEKVGINSALEDVKNLIQGEILKENKQDIELILKLNKGSERFIHTDSRKLKQVLINLLKNSLKFSEKGEIEFGYTVIEKGGSGFLKFYVKDSGIGIDKKYHDVIFNIFRQIDDTHTRKYGGTGIGLAIAKKMIEMLGGEIWVESEPGTGSVFYFTIPVLSGNKDNGTYISDTEKVTENNYTGKTILIAEDDPTSFEFLQIFFRKMNIKVLWAKNGIEAINQCETDPSINLILMDIKMPVLNGYESTREIKKIRPDLPIIAQTAHALLSDREEALNAGCDDYLSKPIEIRHLKEMLERYL